MNKWERKEKANKKEDNGRRTVGSTRREQVHLRFLRSGPIPRDLLGTEAQTTRIFKDDLGTASVVPLHRFGWLEIKVMTYGFVASKMMLKEDEQQHEDPPVISQTLSCYLLYLKCSSLWEPRALVQHDQTQRAEFLSPACSSRHLLLCSHQSPGSCHGAWLSVHPGRKMSLMSWGSCRKAAKLKISLGFSSLFWQS